jgi:rod shape-determining protein MreC
MESVLGRYRNLIILVGVLFLQVLGLAVQVKRSADAEHTRLIRIWAVSAITPLERVLVWGQNGTGNLWHNYFYLRGVRAENRQLKEQIEQMRLEQVRLSEDAAQAHRLQALLAFKEQFVSKTVAAQVIGSSGSDSSRILYIDKGENDGLARDMAVVTADGIVGKILQVFPSVSQVLLINDQSSGVGALTEKSRLQGVLKGTANGEVVLERLMSDEQVEPGENVLTSGGEQIFPKGLPVGKVAQVSGGKGLFLSIKIRPGANLSKLEEVLVVTEKQERQAAAQDTVRMRAADILAQRLPSVPEKPATPEPNAALANPAGAANAAAGSGIAKPQTKPATVPAGQAGIANKAQNPPGTKPNGAGISAAGKALGASAAEAVGGTDQRGTTVPAGPVTRGGTKTTGPNSSSLPTGTTGAAKTAVETEPPNATESKPAVGAKPPNAAEPKPAVGAKPESSPTKPAATPSSASPQSNPQPQSGEDGPH